MSPGGLAPRRHFYEINNKINAKNNISSCTSSLYKKYNKHRISMSSKYNRRPKISKNSLFSSLFSSLLCLLLCLLFSVLVVIVRKFICPIVYISV